MCLTFVSPLNHFTHTDFHACPVCAALHQISFISLLFMDAVCQPSPVKAQFTQNSTKTLSNYIVLSYITFLFYLSEFLFIFEISRLRLQNRKDQWDFSWDAEFKIDTKLSRNICFQKTMSKLDDHKRPTKKWKE